MDSMAAWRIVCASKIDMFIAAFILMASPSLLLAQNSPAAVCHMDSSGFCISGNIQNPPSWTPTQQNSPVVLPPTTPAAAATSTVNATPPRYATPPKLEVDFRNGLLRIVAENISLRDTLKAISAHTGAEVQVPLGTLEDRVYVHLGPGTSEQIIGQLLKGTQFNYLILSSDAEPGGIARLILTKSTTATNGSTNAAASSLSDNQEAPQLYGAVSGDTTSMDLLPPQEAPATDAAASLPAASWIHHDGATLSAEQLDQMQKAQIQQEQQQFSQQLQQKQQQEKDQANQNSSQQ